jgi:hypothetical protein
VRALCTFTWNSGLFTAIPLPTLGTLVACRLVRGRRATTCSTTSSSPWESAESSSA